MTDFGCAANIADGVAIIRLSGEADIAGLDQLRTMGTDVFDTPDLAGVVVDCDAVTFCDSTTLGVLVAWRNRANSERVPLHLRSVPSQMMKVLRITKLDEVFEIDD